MQTYKSMRRECAKFLHASCLTTSILERGLALSYSLPRAASDMMAENAVFCHKMSRFLLNILINCVELGIQE